MPKLTQTSVKALLAPSGKRDVFVYDDELPGFAVRVWRSGAKQWLIQYRNAHGVSRRFKLGWYGVLTAKEARNRAKKQLGRVANGADPAAEKKAARSAATVSELCDQYLEAGKGRIKESTLEVDRSRINRHVKPLLGSRPVTSLTARDMETFLRDVMAGKSAPEAIPQTSPETDAKSQGAEADPKKARKRRGGRKPGGVTRGGPGVAARTLGMFGTILQRAVRDGVIASNPARGIARPKDKAKKPPFSFDAIADVGEAMRAREAEGENLAGLRAIRFLMLTGLRRMEALTLTWGIRGPARAVHPVCRYQERSTDPAARAGGVGMADEF